MRRDFNTEIQSQFSKVRSILSNYFYFVCQSVASDLQARTENNSYVPDVRDSKNSQYRDSLRKKVDAKRIRSIAQVQLAFSDIRSILEDWMMQKMPESFSDIIRTAKDTGVQFTLPELQVLSKQSVGNYFAQKFVADLAAREFYSDFEFTDYATIAKTLKGAEGDACNAIRCYAGTQDEKSGRFSGDWVTDANDFYKMWAYQFLDTENSQLKTAETMLENCTSTEHILLDDDFDKIAHVFRDQSEQDAVKTMAELIMSNTIDEAKLMAFNADLFVKAKTAIAEDAEAKAKEARETLRAALDENHKAQVNSAKMQGEKARAESKASKLNNNVIHR